MKILITGGAGFIGSHLVDMLVSKGHEVTIIDDLSNGTLENIACLDKVTCVKRDISTPFNDKDYLEFSPEVIYHLACFPRSQSFINPTRDVEVNINGMVNVLELARRHNSKVIFSSNSGIYDTENIPINEKAEDKPKTPYDLDKLTAEKYLKLYQDAYNVEYVIFRFATVYGPRQRVSPDWKPVVMEFIDKLSKGIAPTIYWDGEQTRDFIYVKDLVDALMRSMNVDEAIGETMILGSGVETSINMLYKYVNDHLGVDIPSKRGPKALGDIKRMRYDCEKAHTILNWSASTSMNEGIDEMLAHLGLK